MVAQNWRVFSGIKLFSIFLERSSSHPVQIAYSEFQNEVLSQHNALRQKFGNVPPLEMTNELVAAAKKEAEKKVSEFIANGDKFSLVPDEQNRNYNYLTWVFLAFSSIKLNATRILSDWVDQEKVHDWGKNDFNWKSAHFTQMIWKSTDKFGVDHAVGRTKDRKFM